MADTVESFSDMLRAALGTSIDSAHTSFVDMLAEDAIMDFPFAPPGLPRQVKGRTAIADYLSQMSRILVFEKIGSPIVHSTGDPAVTILEFDGHGRGVESGEPYDQRYISVIRTGGGRIVRYRDYWDPLAVLEAVKGSTIAAAVSMEGAYRA